MKNKTAFLKITLLVLFGSTILIGLYFIEPQFLLEKFYDATNNNPVIENYSNSKIILEQYPIISFDALPNEESTRMKIAQKNYESLLLSLRFYKIPAKDVYRKLLRNIRIRELCSKEQLPPYPLLSPNRYVYLCVDDEIIKAYFHLTEELKLSKWNPEALKINSGYRSPNQNDHVSGARNSMHLYGKALDLRIGDINNDHQTNLLDKNLVYNIMDKKVIKYKGGLGFYPGTMILHMDTRGKYARWKYYNRNQGSVN